MKLEEVKQIKHISEIRKNNCADDYPTDDTKFFIGDLTFEKQMRAYNSGHPFRLFYAIAQKLSSDGDGIPEIAIVIENDIIEDIDDFFRTHEYNEQKK